MPSSDQGMSPEDPADHYAAELRAATRPGDHGPVPSFDVLMLGLGPDGHVASLFPGMPALYEQRPVVAVRRAPKPPPTRLNMTLPAIQTAREVWIIAAGESRPKRSASRCPTPIRCRWPPPARAAGSAAGADYSSGLVRQHFGTRGGFRRVDLVGGRPGA
ncbi:MAG: 6-phosphogluconolactonase [Actinoallomurus sp.]|jgi:6-phosphogluconolactonase/glucosamine-6-phosphate isomerase/deaminase|nr:6-phosphogluconolactonase [Actinoallomurus sp.]